MFQSINDYFYFNQKERRGIFALLSIILILIGINIFVIPQLGKEKAIDKNTFIAWVDSLTQKSNEEVEKKIIDYFKFDPNLIAKEEWLKLGLGENQIKIILNYRKAGGKFLEKGDIKRIYSISDEQYSALEPYITIPTSTFANKTVPTQKSAIELNAADSIDLIKISGIGPVFASRILKYRHLLGGYTQPSQLMEVYGIDSAKFRNIKNNFTACDTSKIIQLNINTANFRELLKHPYISYEFVKFIVNARKEEGFNSLGDLLKRKIVSDSLFKKLQPYLKTSNK